MIKWLFAALLLVVVQICFNILLWQKVHDHPVTEERVRQIETELAQAQQDIGQLKQEVLLLQHLGHEAD